MINDELANFFHKWMYVDHVSIQADVPYRDGHWMSEPGADRVSATAIVKGVGRYEHGGVMLAGMSACITDHPVLEGMRVRWAVTELLSEAKTPISSMVYEGPVVMDVTIHLVGLRA